MEPVREFVCAMTGVVCQIVLVNGVETCVEKQ
jgi:hypothetical protein